MPASWSTFLRKSSCQTSSDFVDEVDLVSRSSALNTVGAAARCHSCRKRHHYLPTRKQAERVSKRGCGRDRCGREIEGGRARKESGFFISERNRPPVSERPWQRQRQRAHASTARAGLVMVNDALTCCKPAPTAPRPNLWRNEGTGARLYAYLRKLQNAHSIHRVLAIETPSARRHTRRGSVVVVKVVVKPCTTSASCTNRADSALLRPHASPDRRRTPPTMRRDAQPHASLGSTPVGDATPYNTPATLSRVVRCSKQKRTNRSSTRNGWSNPKP